MIKAGYPILLASAAALALSACSKEATGQVVAVVNGEEITLQEVNAELQGANLPEGADREAAQRAALQRVVDRRVLAQAAREEGLDETPEYYLRQRQLSETLLLQMLSQKVEQTTEVPEQDEIDQYISDNPALFADRQIFLLDRIQFPAPGDMSQLSVLENDMSMDAVVASLNQLGIEFQRGQAQMDSAQVGQERLDRIRSLPDGEPFVVVENGMVYIADVIASEPAPMEAEQLRPAAVATLRRQRLADTMRARLEAEKSGAEISYQDGFAPSDGEETPATASADS
ncbi:MAG: EpsD family peptidyl-prolyl cis-trans isomerase [Erythrobacter sp.]|jgi:EpsD family peptidyl-prolyl cis-trans isomerase|nr:EpsD family peptidyl-prolyl cis-trans isomerase [Erythrobacter sp.]